MEIPRSFIAAASSGAYSAAFSLDNPWPCEFMMVIN
ncbi:Uncharacterised protein [Mycobacteroides abscessus subsp. abscessus]|nr:Uncharacterised protein [Mycobacteroides abscessus subsp. abscessus]